MKNIATGIPACRKLFRSNEFMLKTLQLSCSFPEVKYAPRRTYLQHALKSNVAFSRYSLLFAATCRKCFSQESLLRNIIIFFVAKSKSFFLRSHKKIFAFFLCILQKSFVQLAKKKFAIFSFAKIPNRSKHSWKERKCGQLICLSHKSFCGKNNKTLTLFAKKIMCDRT